MNKHKVKIGAELSPYTPGNFIEIDGERLKLVQNVKLEMGVGRVPVVTVTFMPESVEVDGEMMVVDGEDHVEQARRLVDAWPDWKREGYYKIMKGHGLYSQDTPQPEPPEDYKGDWSTASLKELVEQIEYCGYEHEAGALVMNAAFIELKKRAKHYTLPPTPDTDTGKGNWTTVDPDLDFRPKREREAPDGVHD